MGAIGMKGLSEGLEKLTNLVKFSFSLSNNNILE